MEAEAEVLKLASDHPNVVRFSTACFAERAPRDPPARAAVHRHVALRRWRPRQPAEERRQCAPPRRCHHALGRPAPPRSRARSLQGYPASRHQARKRLPHQVPQGCQDWRLRHRQGADGARRPRRHAGRHPSVHVPRAVPGGNPTRTLRTCGRSGAPCTRWPAAAPKPSTPPDGPSSSSRSCATITRPSPATSRDRSSPSSPPCSRRTPPTDPRPRNSSVTRWCADTARRSQRGGVRPGGVKPGASPPPPPTPSPPRTRPTPKTIRTTPHTRTRRCLSRPTRRHASASGPGSGRGRIVSRLRHCSCPFHQTRVRSISGGVLVVLFLHGGGPRSPPCGVATGAQRLADAERQRAAEARTPRQAMARRDRMAVRDADPRRIAGARADAEAGRRGSPGRDVVRRRRRRRRCYETGVIVLTVGRNHGRGGYRGGISRGCGVCGEAETRANDDQSRRRSRTRLAGRRGGADGGAHGGGASRREDGVRRRFGLECPHA